MFARLFVELKTNVTANNRQANKKKMPYGTSLPLHPMQC